MKALLYKDLKISISPVFYFSFLFVGLIFVPAYPTIIAFYFPLTMINALLSPLVANNDILYCSLLPVRRKDYVLSKILFNCIYEVAFILVAALALFAKSVIYTEEMLLANPGVNSILCLIGAALVMYGAFNLILFVTYFKTMPKNVLATLLSVFLSLVVGVLFGIIPAYIPGLDNIVNVNGELTFQIVYFFGGVVLFLLLNYLAYLFSKKALEEKDL